MRLKIIYISYIFFYRKISLQIFKRKLQEKTKFEIFVIIFKTGCSTNPVGEKSPTGFFICKKEKSRL